MSGLLVKLLAAWLSFVLIIVLTSEANEVSEGAAAAIHNETQEEKDTFRGLLNFTLNTERAISETVQPNENIIFAPINLIGVLGTLLLGSDGISKVETLNVIGAARCDDNLTTREQILHKVLGRMLAKFDAEHRQNLTVNITVAKTVFARSGIEVKDEFKQLSKSIYNSDFQNVNFADANAAKLMNEWVSNNTGGRITELIPPPISPDLQMVLASALYFDGEWDEPFYQNTTWANFNADDGVVQVNMMENRGTVRILCDENRKFQVLGIPYKGKNIIMFIILPDKGVSLRSVISQLTADDLYKLPKKSMEEQEVTYYVPLMNLDACVNLKTVLKKLGLNSVFDASKANLSRIAENLVVSEALHKVTVEVTEAGTLGAASTSLQIESRFPNRDFVIVDRPFLFYVYHRSSAAITFWGTINKPTPFKPVS